jgi:hypothetical protein
MCVGLVPFVCLSLLVSVLSRAAAAAEAELVLAPPATQSIAVEEVNAAAVGEAPPTAQQVVLHQYFYVDFPRAVDRLAYERQLAEAELTLVARRLEQAAPARSFGMYSATFTADMAWQIDYLAAQRRLECLQQAEADLWRQRHAVAALIR